MSIIYKYLISCKNNYALFTQHLANIKHLHICTHRHKQTNTHIDKCLTTRPVGIFKSPTTLRTPPCTGTVGRHKTPFVSCISFQAPKITHMHPHTHTLTCMCVCLSRHNCVWKHKNYLDFLLLSSKNAENKLAVIFSTLNICTPRISA